MVNVRLKPYCVLNLKLETFSQKRGNAEVIPVNSTGGESNSATFESLLDPSGALPLASINAYLPSMHKQSGITETSRVNKHLYYVIVRVS